MPRDKDENTKDTDVDVEEHLHFTRHAEEDEDDIDDFDVAGPRVIADVVLAKTIGIQIYCSTYLY